MWRFDEEAIKAATREEVIEGVNQLERRQESPKLQLNSTSGNIVLIKLILSPWFGFSRSFSSMLGGLTRNSSGHIVAATSALMVWVLQVSSLYKSLKHQTYLFQVDPSSLSKRHAVLTTELGHADPASLAWEDNLVATALNLSTSEIRSTFIWKHCIWTMSIIQLVLD